MNNQTIVCCVVALLLGMLLANMLKSVCGCKLTEGAVSLDLGAAAVMPGAMECATTHDTCSDEHLPANGITEAYHFAQCCAREELRDEMLLLGNEAGRAALDRSRRSSREARKRAADKYAPQAAVGSSELGP